MDQSHSVGEQDFYVCHTEFAISVSPFEEYYLLCAENNLIPNGAHIFCPIWKTAALGRKTEIVKIAWKEKFKP